jgi:hypothetical protein
MSSEVKLDAISKKVEYALEILKLFSRFKDRDQTENRISSTCFHSVMLFSRNLAEAKCRFNPLKHEVQLIFLRSVYTSKKTQRFYMTKISLLMLFKELIYYSDNRTKKQI